MPAPQTKSELLARAAKERDALAAQIDSMTSEQMLAPGAFGWCAKDFLAHLIEWERMVSRWYQAGILRGEKPAVPGEGFTWATIPALNQRIYVQYRDEPLGTILAEWRTSSQLVLDLIESVSEEDLFTRGRHGWTGTSTLAAYLNSCGPSHCDWARKEIRKIVAAGAGR